MPRKKRNTYDLMKLAQSYGCAENALFLTELNQLRIQTTIINNLADRIANGEDADGELAVELRKQCDSCNRTASAVLSAITALGTKPEPKADKLEQFLNE